MLKEGIRLSQASAYFLGVDGGATRCRGRLRDGSGRLLASANGAAANIYVDFDRAIGAIEDVTSAVLQKAGLAGAERVVLGLGLAGLSKDADARRVEGRFPRFEKVRAVNDAVIACLGAHDGADGAIVIAGTGSAAMVRIAGAETIVGGRGFILGDDGSAARIGLEALRATVRAADGLGPCSPMTDALLARFSGGPLPAVEWASDAKPGDYGAFAPLTVHHAARDDVVALPIINQAVAAIAALTHVVQKLGAERVALVGGLGAALRPFFDDALARALRRPAHDPVDGAILLAGGHAPVAGDARG